jgi:hypothetical protein
MILGLNAPVATANHISTSQRYEKPVRAWLAALHARVDKHSVHHNQLSQPDSGDATDSRELQHHGLPEASDVLNYGQ